MVTWKNRPVEQSSSISGFGKSVHRGLNLGNGRGCIPDRLLSGADTGSTDCNRVNINMFRFRRSRPSVPHGANFYNIVALKL